MQFPWSKKTREFDAVITTEDNRIVCMPFPVELGCLMNEKEEEAYAFSPATVLRSRATDKPCVILDERDGLPPAINGEAKLAREYYKSNINKMGHENWRQGFYSAGIDAKKAIVQVYLATAAVGIALFAALILGGILIFSKFQNQPAANPTQTVAVINLLLGQIGG